MVMVKESGEKLGMVASGKDFMPDNATMINNSVAKIYTNMSTIWTNYSMSLSTAMVLVLAVVLLILCLIAFFKISFTAFIVNAEFLVIGGLSIVLLPFGVTQWTKDIGNKPWGILLTLAIKVLVITFFLGLITSFVDKAFVEVAIQEAGDKKDVAKILPTLTTMTISLWFLSFLVSQATEYAGAIANGAVVSTDRMLSSVAGGAGAVAGMATAPMVWGAKKVGGHAISKIPIVKRWNDKKLAKQADAMVKAWGKYGENKW